MRFYSCWCLLFVTSILTAAEQHFEVDSWAFDRGIFKVYQDEWRNGGPIVIAHNPNAAGQPMFVEYDIPFPVAGKYSLSVFVAMADIRPLTVYLDGNAIGKICVGPKRSASWNSSDAFWDDPLEFSIAEAGVHTIKLIAELGPPPHPAVLRFVSAQPFPDG